MNQTCSQNNSIVPSQDYYGSFKNRDFYKGKSFDFCGEWKENSRYFNDDFITSFVVAYTDDRKLSALVACKTTHTSQIANKPILIVSDDRVTGIEDIYAWDFIFAGVPGDSIRNLIWNER